MRKNHLQLNPADREHLQTLVRQHNVSVKVHKRATALLALDRGESVQAAAALAVTSRNSVGAWRDTYKAQGLVAALRDRPRSGRPPRLDGSQRAKVTALACSKPPTGHARWSLRLLADRSVELGLVEAISHNHVRTVLKKTSSSRTVRRRGVSAS